MITALDKNTALVLIDLQKGITGRQTAHPMEGVIGNAAKLVDAFHEAGLPVVIVNVRPKQSGEKRTDVKMPSMGTLPDEFFEIVPELKTNQDDIFITKQTWGAFYETSLHDELQKRGVTGIVLGGVATSIGVEGTARGALERGYNLTFAQDAMTDMVMDAHKHSLQIIFPRIGEVGDTADILRLLPSFS